MRYHCQFTAHQDQGPKLPSSPYYTEVTLATAPATVLILPKLFCKDPQSRVQLHPFH